MKKILKAFTIYEWLFVIACYLTIIILAIINKSNAFEIISTLLGITAATLNVKKAKSCFFFYALFALSYGTISFINTQYGEGILNIFYNLPLYCFTIWNLFFNKKKQETNDKIAVLDKKGWIITIVIIPIVTVAYGFILKSISSALPFFNAMATSFSVIASFLASRRIKQQWFFWSGYSIVSVYIWLNNFIETKNVGLLYLILNCIYIVINVVGWYNWHKLYKKQKEVTNENSTN